MSKNQKRTILNIEDISPVGIREVIFHESLERGRHWIEFRWRRRATIDVVAPYHVGKSNPTAEGFIQKYLGDFDAVGGIERCTPTSLRVHGYESTVQVARLAFINDCEWAWGAGPNGSAYDYWINMGLGERGFLHTFTKEGTSSPMTILRDSLVRILGWNPLRVPIEMLTDVSTEHSLWELLWSAHQRVLDLEGRGINTLRAFARRPEHRANERLDHRRVSALEREE